MEVKQHHNNYNVYMIYINLTRLPKHEADAPVLGFYLYNMLGCLLRGYPQQQWLHELQVILQILISDNLFIMEIKEAAKEDIFEKLKGYDFKHSTVFQSGWNKIKAVLPAEKLFESFIKAQVFFYSR